MGAVRGATKAEFVPRTRHGDDETTDIAKMADGARAHERQEHVVVLLPLVPGCAPSDEGSGRSELAAFVAADTAPRAYLSTVETIAGRPYAEFHAQREVMTSLQTSTVPRVQALVARPRFGRAGT